VSRRVILRRGWVVPLAALLVTAVALAVRKLNPPRFTAESVLVVPVQSNPSSPGDAGEAAHLATTYRGVIASSVPLVQAVARRLAMSTPEVSGAIRVTGIAATSLILLHFYADSPALAERGALAVAQAVSSGIPGIVGGSLSPLEASKAALVQNGSGEHSYSATATTLVSAGAGTPGPAGVTNADTLATTLAWVIPNDQVTLAAVGKRLGMSPDDVQQHLTVAQEDQTSLLRVLFQAQTRATALLGARIAADAVTKDMPAESAIAPHSLQIVRLPTTTSESAVSSVALPVGGVLGLLLGLLLLFAWERANPEIGNARAAEAIGGAPATDVTRLSPATAFALLKRWQGLEEPRRRAPRVASLSVALVAVKADVIPPSDDVGIRSAGSLTPILDLDLARAVCHDVIVLVVSPHTRTREFRLVIDLLSGLGRRPDWTLVAAPRRATWVPRAPWRAVAEVVR
jgi:capsular polysaccharide biosynthesis protein